MSEEQLTPEVQAMLQQAELDYEKYNSPMAQAAYRYQKGFTGNNHGFTEANDTEE